jgi:hypothetical protein
MSDISFAVVSEEDSKRTPYPYIYVEDDGTYREIDEEERKYLEERFHPCDGARPYTKFGLYSLTPDGKIGGYLERTKLPRDLKAGSPVPPRPWWRFWP